VRIRPSSGQVGTRLPSKTGLAGKDSMPEHDSKDYSFSGRYLSVFIHLSPSISAVYILESLVTYKKTMAL